MNINRLINMIVRRVMRQMMSKGIDAGIDRFSKPRQDETGPQHKARKDASRKLAQKAQKSGRLVGRLGRF